MKPADLICLALGMLLSQCAARMDERHKSARRMTLALLERVKAC